MKNAQKSLKLLVVVSLISGTALAGTYYDDPWLPDWSGETGYTNQFWGLFDVGGSEPAVPLTADIYKTNSGSATASWTNHTGEMVAWASTAMGQQPAWVDGVYGGMVQISGGFWDIGADVDTGNGAGSLKIFVQYDWYSYGSISVNVAGATDVTPAGYYDVVIGTSGSDNDWLRTTKVFEFADNPGSIEVIFDASGFAPMIDSFSVTTAVGAAVPAQMPIPEPATMALLGIGSFVMLRRRK